MLHIIHNAASDMLTVTPMLDEQIHPLSLVCKLLTDPQTCARLCEKCFDSAIGKELSPKLQTFQHRVYRSRWGTAAYAVDALLAIKPVLLHGWSLEKYTSEATKVGPEIKEVDAALRSDMFWGSVMVLDKLYELIREAFAWAEGCACHTHLDWRLVDKDTLKRWEDCPLRGHRLPELCAGDFFHVLDTLGNTSTLRLLQSLPSDLTTTNRAHLVCEFEAGRSHLMYTFSLKLGAFL